MTFQQVFYGETVGYQKHFLDIVKPSAVRAVAGDNGRKQYVNKYSLSPHHRHGRQPVRLSRQLTAKKWLPYHKATVKNFSGNLVFEANQYNNADRFSDSEEPVFRRPQA